MSPRLLKQDLNSPLCGLALEALKTSIFPNIERILNAYYACLCKMTEQVRGGESHEGADEGAVAGGSETLAVLKNRQDALLKDVQTNLSLIEKIFVSAQQEAAASRKIAQQTGSQERLLPTANVVYFRRDAVERAN